MDSNICSKRIQKIKMVPKVTRRHLKYIKVVKDRQKVPNLVKVVGEGRATTRMNPRNEGDLTAC